VEPGEAARNRFRKGFRTAKFKTANGREFTDSIIANSPLVSQIVFKQSGTTRMTTTKSYDFLNRLTQISSAPSAASTVSYGYAYNSANQRTRVTLADGSYWQYIYDSLGQVVSGHRFFADGTPVAGQQFDYSFDNIGNRTQALAGGDQTGQNQRSASYTANNLNQYSSRGVPGYVDVMGQAFATNSVTVNSTSAYQKGEYFRQQLTAANSTSPVWSGVTVSQSGQNSVSGNLFVAQTPESFGYDLDGNLTSDGRWNYTWDAENRLIKLAARTSVGPQNSLQFEYDSKSRRIRKQVWSNTTWTGSPTNDLKFLYDGWNLVAEVGSSGSVVQSYAWGLDLSGSGQGAGGVGGLIEVNDANSGVSFVAYDGNGNMGALVNAVAGTNSARYEYGPFGELTRTTGAMAKLNPFRFSTKYQDDESDLIYYCFRYYNVSAGRWLSRDPLADTRLDHFSRAGFDSIRASVGAIGQRSQHILNPYVFIANCPILATDYLGLDVNSPPSSVSSQASCGCKCGLSVDGYVAQTLVNITQAFRSADYLTKCAACNDLWIPDSPGFVIDEWDMPTIQSGVPPVIQTSFCSPCSSRLTFRGGCYDSADVNYLMWGHITSLCNEEFGNWSAQAVAAAVRLVKGVRGQPVGCAEALALSGFDGRPVSCSDGNSKNICQPNSKPFTGGDPNNWVWEPLRHRKK
jgi:RHS repeat-associated protein